MELEETPLNGYLTDRHQYTEINDTLLTSSYITCGVPQCSILGPYYSRYTSMTSLN